MEHPVQITFRGFEPTDAIKQTVEERANRLEMFFDKIDAQLGHNRIEVLFADFVADLNVFEHGNKLKRVDDRIRNQHGIVHTEFFGKAQLSLRGPFDFIQVSSNAQDFW